MRHLLMRRLNLLLPKCLSGCFEITYLVLLNLSRMGPTIYSYFVLQQSTCPTHYWAGRCKLRMFTQRDTSTIAHCKIDRACTDGELFGRRCSRCGCWCASCSCGFRGCARCRCCCTFHMLDVQIKPPIRSVAVRVCAIHDAVFAPLLYRSVREARATIAARIAQRCTVLGGLNSFHFLKGNGRWHSKAR